MLREFDAQLQKGENPGAWTCVVMNDVAELFGTRGLVKIRGAIDGRPFTGALMAQGDGTHRLPVRATVRTTIGKEASDIVRVRIDERCDTHHVHSLSWLSEYSEPALRTALRAAGGGLEHLPIELTGTNDLTRPTWASGSATIDRRFLAKFAFSKPTAIRVWHEARVLKMLKGEPADAEGWDAAPTSRRGGQGPARAVFLRPPGDRTGLL